VWFFVSLHGGQAEALRSGSQVNLAVSDAGSWLSVAGEAGFVEDRALVEQLWNDRAESYFPGGTDDPDLGLLRVSGESAQFWGMPGGKVAGLAQIIKAKATGEQAPGGSGTTQLCVRAARGQNGRDAPRPLVTRTSPCPAPSLPAGAAGSMCSTSTPGRTGSSTSPRPCCTRRRTGRSTAPR